MQGGPIEIIRCPPNLVPEALSLVLSELAPSQRREVAGSLKINDSAVLANEPLFAAFRSGELCAAAWGQRQPGNIAVFWPPRLTASEPIETAYRLAEAVALDLDAEHVEMTQVLVSPSDSDLLPMLQHVNFRPLADLLYLTCEASRFPRDRPVSADISFASYDDSQRPRLKRLIERSYEGTRDCVGLNGARDVDNVVAGYRATGEFRPENWLIVTAGDADVGALLLADHPKAQHLELMYMGLVPEFRGRGWGRQITQHALWLAREARVERMVLAVDSVNEPALRMYRNTGFEMWDRRLVYVRFPSAFAEREGNR